MSAAWQRIEEVFHAALELPPEKRADFIRTICAGDPALAAEVDGMLRAHEEAGAFLEQPALERQAATFAGPGSGDTLAAGTSLGGYRIISLLGAGGMGEVYLAEETALGRAVALKFIQGGTARAGLARSLGQEARILAGLTHPNIARLYGVGATPDGGPFFIMEYVAGQRLDDFCRDRCLTIKERLGLFREVCAAVSYAHQHLVIHRDLKPANIRVTPEGVPKLLDFGIAKLLDSSGTEPVEKSNTLAGMMTPDYASPEQIRGESMTTASDVYSLGVVLYELLTGARPHCLTSSVPHERARALSEDEPLRPSQHRPELAGDLDNILLMALGKAPERRYASVALFSHDLERHLAGRPVLAHRDTALYRAGKFVRRHRGAVLAAGLILLALLSGLVAANWQAQVARRAQVKAETARRQADRLNRFLEDLMSSADPAQMGKDGKVVPMLDAASEKLDHELADEPEILARAHETLRRAYQHLGLFDRAELHARAALALVRRLHGPADPATARAEFHLADVFSDRYRPQEAEPLLRHALAMQRAETAPNDSDLADILETLSFVYITEKRPAEAEKAAREAVARARAAWGEQDPRFLRVLNEMGNIQIAKGDYAAAAPIYRRLIALNDKMQPGALGSLAPQINLCITLFNLEKFAELEPVVDRLQSDAQRLVGEHGLPTAIALAVRGCLDFVRGQDVAAIPFLRQALAILPNNYPPGQTTVVQCRALLGLCLTRTGHPSEGEPLLRQALADGGQVDRAEFAHTFGNLESALGECLLTQHRESEARPLLLTGYHDLEQRLGDRNPLTIQAAGRLHTLAQAQPSPPVR